MLDKIDIKDIEKIAKEAASKILPIYSGDFAVNIKEDNTPITLADKVANEHICQSLLALYSDIPILSEENRAIPYKRRKDWDYYWCIDPIDGTKEFIKKNGEFTINIALIAKNTPVLGVVYAPIFDKLYSAKKAEGVNFDIQPKPSNIVLVSRSHHNEQTKAFIDSLDSVQILPMGSSLKLCKVADGSALLYPKLGDTKEWDTAAAHAILLECGKNIIEFHTQKQLTYNKPSLVNPWFIAK